MPRSLSVHFLPALFQPDEVRGGTVVVVDILRASTTISHALANGAHAIVPCGSVDEALQIRTQYPSGMSLLGGERSGVKIDGFDLSNSPDDYGRSIVADKVIGFTTTNGTKALLRSEQADAVMIGAFVNITRVWHRLLADSRPVHIVCAGTDGCITGEDVLFAGALAHRLTDSATAAFAVDDSCQIAIDHWLCHCGTGDSAAVEAALKQSRGGQNLLRLGYDHDITTAAAIDSVAALGILNPERHIMVELA